MEAAEELASFYNGQSIARTATAETALEAYQLRPNDGVKVERVPITRYETVTVTYDGHLAKAGAQQVILHWGHGAGPWRKVQEQSTQWTHECHWEALETLNEGVRC